LIEFVCSCIEGGEDLIEADVAIVGFGFAGLASLMHLVRTRTPQTVAVISPDDSGLGLAYRTRDPSHLLNVQANRMGAWADDPADFAQWLTSGAGAEACECLGLAVPGSTHFAPRMLYGRYLSDRRDRTLDDAAACGMTVRLIAARAIRIVREAQRWVIATPFARICTQGVVLATGHDQRPVFGDLRHPDLYDGPWQLTAAEQAGRDGPVALIGSGLTAVDSVLSLRGLGYAGEIVALSRGGRLPESHRRGVNALQLESKCLGGLRSLSAVVEFIHDARSAGHDWRSAIDALRPHTWAVWQRLGAADQQAAVTEWSSLWKVLRHRMAPGVGLRIDRELGDEGLRVLATRRITPVRRGDRIELEVEDRDGGVARLRPTAVVDCTGPQLDCAQSDQPLLRGLIEDGTCVPHHTGLGLRADRHHQVAENFYALGGLLTGQLWETVAVPELRQQAALIAARLSARSQISGDARVRL
jgi:uncharacterized NAD(P)/FAD-binding protein YdhS